MRNKSSNNRKFRWSSVGILVLWLLVIQPTTALSQYSTNFSISIKAVVTNNIPFEIISLKNMRVHVLPNDNQNVYISPLTNPDAGMLMAKGRTGTRVLISFLKSDELIDQQSKASIKIDYELSGSPGQTQFSSDPFHNEEAIIDLPENGTYYLWVGCRVNLSGVSGGKFLGLFTIEIDYI